MAKSAARNPAKRPAPAKPGKNRKWSAEVSKHSNALDLEEGVFKKRNARQIALSLKSSAEAYATPTAWLTTLGCGPSCEMMRRSREPQWANGWRPPVHGSAARPK